MRRSTQHPVGDLYGKLNASNKAYGFLFLLYPPADGESLSPHGTWGSHAPTTPSHCKKIVYQHNINFEKYGTRRCARWSRLCALHLSPPNLSHPESLATPDGDSHAPSDLPLVPLDIYEDRSPVPTCMKSAVPMDGESVTMVSPCTKTRTQDGGSVIMINPGYKNALTCIESSLIVY